MKRLVGGSLVLALLAFVTLGPSRAQDKNLSIKDIMGKAHKGGDALLSKLGKELKGTDVPWEDVQKQAKELVDLGTSLSKATPSKGDKSSWDKLTASYLSDAKALSAAAEKKNKDDAVAAQKKLSTSCKACHSAHKGS